jgi:hypothetical protein
MALTKVSKLDKYEIVNADTIPMIQCRHAVWVEEDGVMIGGKQYHRHVITPADDVSNEDAQIQAVASAIFTDEIKAAYAAKLAEETV